MPSPKYETLGERTLIANDTNALDAITNEAVGILAEKRHHIAGGFLVLHTHGPGGARSWLVIGARPDAPPREAWLRFAKLAAAELLTWGHDTFAPNTETPDATAKA